MTQDNVEQKRDIKWIVPLPQGEGGMFGRPSLCAACRGNEDIGVVLNYFVFEASREAKNKKIDLEKAEYIRLKRGLDEILDGIKPSRTSKTTLIGYHHKLHEWGLVLSDGYKQQYDVYFHKITEAIQNPPPEEKRKPRGRHVTKSLVSTDSNSEDSSFNNGPKLESSTVKTEIQEDSNFNQISVLTSQISKLEFEILNLKSEISALTSQMLNLKSSESSEVAPQQAGDTQNDALRLLRDCNRLLKTIKGNMVAIPRNMFSLLTEEDYRTIDELMTVASVASATPSPLIENLYQSQSLSENYPPEPPKGSARTTTTGRNDTPLTPAGRIASTIVEQGDINAVTSRDIDASRYPADLRHSDNIHPHSVLEDHTKVELSSTAVDGENHHADANTMAPDHNTSSEPPNRQKTGVVESQPKTPPTQDKPPVGEYSAPETPSSTQSVKDLSNQATEQGKQASGVDLIAEVATKKAKVEVPAGPPIMPGDDAIWNAETIVQIHEAHQGRRYPNGAKRKSDRIRDKELVSAQSLLAMSSDLWTPNASENRQHLLDIIIRLETRHNNWWIDTNGHVMPHQLVDKDRIHMINDEIKRQRPSNVTPMPQRQQQSSNGTSSFRAPTGLVDKDEMNKLMDMEPEQRREYMLAKKQARLAQEQQQRAVL